MSDPRDPAPLADAERRARDAVRALPAAAPDPAWRSSLGEAFARGAIAEGRFSHLPAVPDPGDDAEAEAPPADARLIALPRRRPRPRAWWMAAAAAAVLIVIGWAARGPGWQVVGATPGGWVTIGGRRVAMTDTPHLRAALVHGGALRVDGGRLWLRARGTLAIEVVPGTVARLPEAPGAWLGHQLAAHVDTGELRITTGARFHGDRLTVTTPEAHVEVTGTTLAVIREPEGTCVCVFEGRVMVGPRAGPMRPITAGDRGYVYADGRPPIRATMRDDERPELARLRAAQRPEMDAGR